MLRHLIKYILLKIKWRGKLRFKWSSRIGFDSIFEGMNQIHSHAVFNGFMGYGSYLGPYSDIAGKVGRFTSIAPFVRCNAGRHPYTYPYVSTAPCFISPNPNHTQNGSSFASEQLFEEYSFADAERKYSVVIGNDCWIGEGVFIVGGVTINSGAVVLAHAVVTKDVPPFAIVGGIPAKVVGFRYSDDDIKFLIETEWWNNTPEWIKQNWELLNDFDRLKETISNI